MRVGPSAAVGGVALHDGAVQHPYQIADQGRLEVVVASRLAGRYLDGDLPFGLAVQRLVDPDQTFGCDLPREVDLRGLRRVGRRGRAAAATFGGRQHHR